MQLNDDPPNTFLGWIDAGRTWPGLDLDAWFSLIRTFDQLAPIPTRCVHNPFHPDKLVEVPPRPGHALVVVDGRVVGQMSLEGNGPIEILIHGDRAIVPAIAREIASRLNAKFFEVRRAQDARST